MTTRMHEAKWNKIAIVAVAAIMGTSPLAAVSTYMLTADEDWYASGKIMLADGVTVDLAGHKLTVGGFADYVPLDYVETDGTQWVHTEFTPDGTDTFEMKFMKELNSDDFLLCSRSNGSTDGFGVWVSGFSWKDIEFIYRSRGGVGVYGKSATATTGIYDANGVVSGRDYTVMLNGDKLFWVVNGVTNDFSNTTNGKNGVVPSGPFALFGGHVAGASLSTETAMSYMAKCRFYYLKVWNKDGNLKCNIVPAYGIREKAVGLYDTVRNKFMLPVKNGGATTTFAKTYQELDHIDTDGNQIVDTGFVHAWTNRIEMRARMLKNSGYQALFGSRGYASSGAATGAYVCWTVDSGFRFDYSSQVLGGSFGTAEDCEIAMSPEVCEKSGKEYWSPRCLVDGTEVVTHGAISVARSTIDGGISVRNQPCRLFGLVTDGSGTVGYCATCRFYSLKIYNNSDKGTLLCDIVPAIGANENAIGLYDRVRNCFMQSSKNPFPVSFAMAVTNSSAERATLEVSVADGAAITNGCVAVAEDCIDLAKSGGGSWTCGNGGFDVFGTFTFSGGAVAGLTMQNGSVLDLSGLASPLDLDGCGLAFASDPTVYILLGGTRKLSSSTPIISWSTVPQVRFERGNDVRDYGLAAKSDGLYAVSGLVLIFR